MSNTTATTLDPKALNAHFKKFFKKNEDLLSDDDTAVVGQAQEDLETILQPVIENNPEVKAAYDNFMAVLNAYVDVTSDMLQG